ncbi:MAG TPA: hypothetical protein PLP28_11860, partial [Flavobacteriales bacterium]|nr:hypothetical protein [Flavobacteriales bacterium]
PHVTLSLPHVPLSLPHVTLSLPHVALSLPKGEHGGTEILEYMDRLVAESPGHGLGESDAVTFHHEVDVLAGPADEQVANVPADGESRDTALARFLSHSGKERLIHHAFDACGIHGICSGMFGHGRGMPENGPRN